MPDNASPSIAEQIRHQIDIATADLPELMDRTEVASLVVCVSLHTAAELLEHAELFTDPGFRAEVIRELRRVADELTDTEPPTDPTPRRSA